MAKIVTETVTISFSKLVPNGVVLAEGTLVTDEDLTNLTALITELYQDDPSRVVEVEGGETSDS